MNKQGKPSSLNQAIEAFTRQQWTSLLRNGLETYLSSVAKGVHPPDCSGFGRLGILVEQENLVPALVKIFERTPPGVSQERFRLALKDIILGLRPPPDTSTLLIVDELLQLAAEVRAVDAIGALARRCAAGVQWRQHSKTYHAALHFAMVQATHSDSARLIRAVIGKAGNRSKHFEVGQIHPSLRTLISCEPHRLADHVLFFEPEASSADLLIQGPVAAAIHEAKEHVDPLVWRRAEVRFPAWVRQELARVDGNDSALSPAVVDRLLTQVLKAVPQVSETAPADPLQDRLPPMLEDVGRMLSVAAAVSPKLLLEACERLLERTENSPARLKNMVDAAVGPHREQVAKELAERPTFHAVQDFLSRTAKDEATDVTPIDGLPPEDVVIIDMMTRKRGHA